MLKFKKKIRRQKVKLLGIFFLLFFATLIPYGVVQEVEWVKSPRLREGPGLNIGLVAVAQLVEALHCKPAGRGFNSL